MWVRSQNKDLLIDVKVIYWGKKAYVDSYMVYTKDLSHNTTVDIELGFYKTSEKAMQVMDDLQCRIARSESGVYQMPEDDEWTSTRKRLKI